MVIEVSETGGIIFWHTRNKLTTHEKNKMAIFIIDDKYFSNMKDLAYKSCPANVG